MKRYYSYLMISLLLFCAILVSLSVGTYHIGIPDILSVLTGGGSAVQRMTILDLRLPRIAAALVAGTALASSGSVLQSLTKNDLAEPGILGINAGASLAVICVINAGGTVYYNALSNFRLYMIPVAAVCGALLTAVLIFRLSSYRGRVSRTALVLIGIGVNAGMNAVIIFLQLRMSKGDYNQALTWISGSLWGSSWKFFWLAAPVVVIFTGLILYKGRTLDIMDLGEELAIGLGVRTERERRLMFAIAVVLAAMATAVAGNMSFVGLLGPHIARSLTGPSYRRHIPLGAVISGLLIVTADTICKNAFSPLEIPAGIMISMIGVPYFIYLMRKA